VGSAGKKKNPSKSGGEGVQAWRSFLSTSRFSVSSAPADAAPSRSHKNSILAGISRASRLGGVVEKWDLGDEEVSV
jgi:hypothetical protein